MENPSLWRIFKLALSHFFDSKTYFWLFWSSLLVFIAFIIVMALWGDVLFKELLYFFGANTTGGVIRSGFVDGGPKIAAAIQNPNSMAANPPPGVSQPQVTQILPSAIDSTPTSFIRPPL